MTRTRTDFQHKECPVFGRYTRALHNILVAISENKWKGACDRRRSPFAVSVLTLCTRPFPFFSAFLSSYPSYHPSSSSCSSPFTHTIPVLNPPRSSTRRNDYHGRRMLSTYGSRLQITPHLPDPHLVSFFLQPIDFDGDVNLFHFVLLRCVGKGAFGKVGHPLLCYLHVSSRMSHL